MTVVETRRFIKDANRLMPEAYRAELVNFIGANPEAGDLVPESGGIRKLRWALPRAGERGGARVIYYFHNENLPLFLLAAYGKNEKANLTKDERNRISKLVPILVREYPAGLRKKS
jgi:hypothetical protein